MAKRLLQGIISGECKMTPLTQTHYTADIQIVLKSFPSASGSEHMTSIEKAATTVFIGACTSLLVALGACTMYVSTDLPTVHPVGDFILPTSAFVSGVAGVTGYASSCRFLAVRPNALSAILMLLVTISALILVYYQSPATASYRDGTLVGYLAALPALLPVAFSAACDIAVHGTQVGDIDILDTLGCALATLNLAGVATALLALFLLHQQIYPGPARASGLSAFAHRLRLTSASRWLRR